MDRVTRLQKQSQARQRRKKKVAAKEKPNKNPSKGIKPHSYVEESKPIKIYMPEDLNKMWFIYWTTDSKRVRLYGKINQHKNFDDRYAAAMKLIQEVTSSGYKTNYNPKLTKFRNEAYQAIADRSGFLRKKTVAGYKSTLNVFFEWLGNREVSKKNVKQFLIEASQKKHLVTYNKYINHLTRIFGLMDQEYLLEGMERAKCSSTPARYFQNHQIKRIKRYIKEHDPTIWLATQFLYYCFIRPTELRFLKVGDILFDDWKIVVRPEVSKNKRNQYVTIPLSFRPVLEPLMDRDPLEYIFHKKGDPTKPVSVNYISYRHRKYLRELGFSKEYKFYSWKHTGAVKAVKAGVSLKELQMQLRHHSLDEVDGYLRQMGVMDMDCLVEKFPSL